MPGGRVGYSAWFCPYKKSEVAELGSHLKGSSVQLPEGLVGTIQYFPPSLSFL